MNTFRFFEILSVNFKLCILEISSAITRTTITTFGLFLGVAALLINLAFVRGMDDDLRSSMEQIGGLNILNVKQVDPKTPQERKQFQRSPGLSFASVELAVEGLPYVNSVIHSQSLRWQTFSGIRNNVEGFLIAVNPTYFPIFNYKILKGRLLTDTDMQNKSDVCIIGNRLAQRLFPGVDPIGKRITVRSISLTVVGVIKSGGIRSRRDSECCIPFSFFAARFEDADKNLKSISIALTGSEHIEQARTELTARFTKLHRGVNDFEIESSADKISEMRGAALAMKLIFTSIAVISLLVGGISIMNIMFASLGDRIREIGIRKALGARRGDILTQFMLEAILICLGGGLPGILLGTGIIFLPQGAFPYSPRLTMFDFVIALGFILSIGLLSGLFPALKAANMQPVEALRN